MSATYKYGVYGLGRIGKVHASIVQDQGQQILAIGDDIQAAIVAFQDELTVDGVKTFHDPALQLSANLHCSWNRRLRLSSGSRHGLCRM